MPAEPGVLGVFGDLTRGAKAIRALRAAGHGDIRTASPAPFPELVEALGRPRSRLDSVTLSGALLGTLAGFALCIGTAIAWPLVTGGKPIVSVPPFVIIAFEVSVLIGAGVNLVALAVTAGRGRRRRPVPFDPRFSADRIGVFVVGGNLLEAETILMKNGAEEVRRVA
jgi:molybdopterin-containing oxidoreductase family membrane subunit